MEIRSVQRECESSGQHRLLANRCRARMEVVFSAATQCLTSRHPVAAHLSEVIKLPHAGSFAVEWLELPFLCMGESLHDRNHIINDKNPSAKPI